MISHIIAILINKFNALPQEVLFIDLDGLIYTWFAQTYALNFFLKKAIFIVEYVRWIVNMFEESLNIVLMFTLQR